MEILVFNGVQMMILVMLSSAAFGIRTDVLFDDTETQTRICRTSVQGRYLICDDVGYVCDALSLDPKSHCCPSNRVEQYSCHGCNLVSRCCNSYEYCVSCCLNPARTPTQVALKVKIAKPATAGMYSSLFDFCTGRCRHNSGSVLHENAYLSDFHHCFAPPPSSLADGVGVSEVQLIGINVTVGKQGESCDSVCKSSGQSCVPTKFLLLNQCEFIRKYMNCRGSCVATIGTDQPAQVVEDAPANLNPGACLFSARPSMMSCDGSHRHTRRLCPCA